MRKGKGEMKISETHRYEIHTPDGIVAGCIYVRVYFNGKPNYIANFKCRFFASAHSYRQSLFTRSTRKEIVVIIVSFFYSIRNNCMPTFAPRALPVGFRVLARNLHLLNTPIIVPATCWRASGIISN